MSSHHTEIDTLMDLMPELEAEGYEVFVNPSRSILPAFLKNFMPDVIARKEGKNLAIEVKRRSTSGDAKIQKIQELFKNQKDWDFRIIWIAPSSQPMSMDLPSRSIVKSRIKEVESLASMKHGGAAFLLAWATFEAISRLLLPDQFQRPQTPSRLIETLAGDGYLTPTEADILRRMAEKRNKLIHGDLKTRISKSEVNKLLEILRTLSKIASDF